MPNMKISMISGICKVQNEFIDVNKCTSKCFVCVYACFYLTLIFRIYILRKSRNISSGKEICNMFYTDISLIDFYIKFYKQYSGIIYFSL